MAILTDDQVAAYRAQGFLSLPAYVDRAWLERLSTLTDEYVERSRRATAPSPLFEFEPDHTPEAPRLRRLAFPADLHETYWEFASTSPIVDVVAELIGPDVKFHHSKLNFKEPAGGEEVRWHQDIQFWPHTNYDLLTVGVFLDDVTPEMGNVGFVPGSHAGPLHDQFRGETWAGCLSDDDARAAGVDRAVYPTGPAGTVTIHNCRTVHGSAVNRSDRRRRLLLGTYAPADAFAYTDTVRHSPHGDVLIRGEPARWARHDPRPCQVAPLVGGSIFDVQTALRATPGTSPVDGTT